MSRKRIALLATVLLGAARASAQSTDVFQSFDSDPHWDGLRNRSVPSPGPTVSQNFGFRNTNIAGGAAGELGGHIERTTRPAWYADDIANLSFNDTLTASGKISMPNQSSSAGLHFGWFNSERQGWRPWSSIGFRLDGRGAYSNILLDYMTQTWKAGGVNLGNSNPIFRVPHDNSDHTWNMQYNPSANSGSGALTFTFDGNSTILNLDAGFKAQGATFNRFGLWNQQASSGGMDAYFDDVTYNGTTQNFNNASTGWEANGNIVTFQDPEPAGAHNYGYSNSHHANGTASGELGGLIFRPDVHAETYYAGQTNALTLNNRLFASGKVSLARGASDGGTYFGWFNKQSIENTVEQQPQIANPANYLGITMEGPSREGFYFRPVFSTSDATKRDSGDGPIIFPDAAAHDFSMLYDPAANGGMGRITVTLDNLVKVFDLTASDRAKGALFDHFGMFGISPGGHYVEAYFDDLTYTIGTGPGNGTWGVDASGDWQVTSNWTNSLSPNLMGATANFGNVITADRMVYTNSLVSLGTMNFNSPHMYLLAGLGSLTMQTSSGSAQINVEQGTHKINVPLTIASNTVLNISDGALLLIADPVTVSPGKSLTKTGSGMVTYQSTVKLGAGSTLSLMGDAEVGSLAMDASAKVDLAGSLVVSRDGVAAVRANVMRGFNGGDWRGNGITSSPAAADPTQSTALGMAEGDDGVLVKYTYYGDANLDGDIGRADFEAFTLGYVGGDANWTVGDFDYSGAITADDFDLFLRGYIARNGLQCPGDLFAELSSFVHTEGLNVDLTAVPEPAACALLAAGSLTTCRRRRR